MDSAEKTAIAVDCENSDPYKLYSVLKGLNQDELAKIEKITLYDDPHTTAGWDWLSKFTQIPTEHIEIDRVTDRKSLVDVRMTASVVTDFYRDGITSFIIVSSDSDFWGLIESLPKAKFLVMYEYEKCGTAIKNALAQHGIYYCAIDDFCTAGTEDMKRAVLFAELEKHLPSLVGENPLDLTHKIYEATRVTATMKEMENFCNRYVKTLRLKVNSEGKFEIEIQR
ncbi:NYN domain-containing protein [Ruminococcus sp. YE71]|uniref:NYN domain-containing protein n=1 Tax=unclassified Ruminococcus TaxID=2608920 RepID=UPI00325B5E04